MRMKRKGTARCRPAVSGLPEGDQVPGRLAVEIGGDLVRDQSRGGAPGIVAEVGVARPTPQDTPISPLDQAIEFLYTRKAARACLVSG